MTLLMENYAASLLVVPEVEIEAEVVAVAPVVIPEATPRTLAEQSLTEIKKLYELFIETGEKVGNTLGIN